MVYHTRVNISNLVLARPPYLQSICSRALSHQHAKQPLGDRKFAEPCSSTLLFSPKRLRQNHQYERIASGDDAQHQHQRHTLFSSSSSITHCHPSRRRG